MRNATIWTGNKGGEEIIRGDVLMDGGLVVRVGKVEEKAISAVRGKVHEINLHGSWVTPGLVDGHSHGE